MRRDRLGIETIPSVGFDRPRILDQSQDFRLNDFQYDLTKLCEHDILQAQLA